MHSFLPAHFRPYQRSPRRRRCRCSIRSRRAVSRVAIPTGRCFAMPPARSMARHTRAVPSAPAPGPGYGTVFKLTPPRPGETGWSETVLYRFAGGADGWSPLAVLTADATGALYGTTLYGGVGRCQDNWGFVAGCGTVFKLTPPTP